MAGCFSCSLLSVSSVSGASPELDKSFAARETSPSLTKASTFFKSFRCSIPGGCFTISCEPVGYLAMSEVA